MSDPRWQRWQNRHEPIPPAFAPALVVSSALFVMVLTCLLLIKGCQ